MIPKPIRIHGSRQCFQGIRVRHGRNLHLESVQDAPQKLRYQLRIPKSHLSGKIPQNGLHFLFGHGRFPKNRQSQHTGMTVCEAKPFCQRIGHGVRCRRTGQVYRLAALVGCVKHLFRSMRIPGCIFLQVIQYTENGEEGMYMAVFRSGYTPVTLNPLRKRVQGSRFPMVQRKGVQQVRVQDNGVRPQG